MDVLNVKPTQNHSNLTSSISAFLQAQKLRNDPMNCNSKLLEMPSDSPNSEGPTDLSPTINHATPNTPTRQMNNSVCNEDGGTHDSLSNSFKFEPCLKAILNTNGNTSHLPQLSSQQSNMNGVGRRQKTHNSGAKAGTKKSFVWKYFQHPEMENGVLDRTRTQCLLCDSQLAFNASGTTTTMLNHLKSRHGEVAETEETNRRQSREYLISPNGGSAQRSSHQNQGIGSISSSLNLGKQKWSVHDELHSSKKTSGNSNSSQRSKYASKENMMNQISQNFGNYPLALAVQQKAMLNELLGNKNFHEIMKESTRSGLNTTNSEMVNAAISQPSGLPNNANLTKPFSQSDLSAMNKLSNLMSIPPLGFPLPPASSAPSSNPAMNSAVSNAQNNQTSPNNLFRPFHLNANSGSNNSTSPNPSSNGQIGNMASNNGKTSPTSIPNYQELVNSWLNSQAAPNAQTNKGFLPLNPLLGSMFPQPNQAPAPAQTANTCLPNQNSQNRLNPMPILQQNVWNTLQSMFTNGKPPSDDSEAVAQTGDLLNMFMRLQSCLGQMGDLNNTMPLNGNMSRDQSGLNDIAKIDGSADENNVSKQNQHVTNNDHKGGLDYSPVQNQRRKRIRPQHIKVDNDIEPKRAANSPIDLQMEHSRTNSTSPIGSDEKLSNFSVSLGQEGSAVEQELANRISMQQDCGHPMVVDNEKCDRDHEEKTCKNLAQFLIQDLNTIDILKGEGFRSLMKKDSDIPSPQKMRYGYLEVLKKDVTLKLTKKFQTMSSSSTSIGSIQSRVSRKATLFLDFWMSSNFQEFCSVGLKNPIKSKEKKPDILWMTYEVNADVPTILEIIHSSLDEMHLKPLSQDSASFITIITNKAALVEEAINLADESQFLFQVVPCLYSTLTETINNVLNTSQISDLLRQNQISAKATSMDRKLKQRGESQSGNSSSSSQHDGNNNQTGHTKVPLDLRSALLLCDNILQENHGEFNHTTDTSFSDSQVLKELHQTLQSIAGLKEQFGSSPEENSCADNLLLLFNWTQDNNNPDNMTLETPQLPKLENESISGLFKRELWRQFKNDLLSTSSFKNLFEVTAFFDDKFKHPAMNIGEKDKCDSQATLLKVLREFMKPESDEEITEELQRFQIKSGSSSEISTVAERSSPLANLAFECSLHSMSSCCVASGSISRTSALSQEAYMSKRRLLDLEDMHTFTFLNRNWMYINLD